MGRGKVMVVDDDREFLQELKETLELSGYKVAEVNDPTKVQEQADVFKPDMLVLDLKMEGMSGFEVAEELKHFAATSKIPVVAMTGYFNEEEHMSLMDVCGIKLCLKKPFNPLDVIAAVEDLMSTGRKPVGSS